MFQKIFSESNFQEDVKSEMNTYMRMKNWRDEIVRIKCDAPDDS